MSQNEKAQLRAAIERRAAELGFLRVGFVSIPKTQPDIDTYDAWLAEGRHAAMGYMPEQRDARADETHLLDNARTAIICMASYAGHSDSLGDMRVARYAQGDDYHDRVTDKLSELAAFVRAESGCEVNTRSASDMFPLLERDLARRAGLGWPGKNAMLINQEVGSFTLLGSVLADIDVAGEPTPAPDRCGTCRSCIDICPTNAISAPGLIDARRCISYLTIELRGPIPRPLRPLIGDHLFGCDLCQNVCPWNSKAPPAEAAKPFGLNRRDVFEGLGPADVLSMSRETYARSFRGSAMKRARYDGLLRNAAVVLGNSANADHAGVLVSQIWENDEPLVRGHIAWALSRIHWNGAKSALRNRAVIETDSYVQEEIRWALLNTHCS